MKGGESKMRCWSCGTEIPGGLRYLGVCPTCRQVEETKKIREGLESSGAQSLYGAIELVGEELAEGLSEIAGILEWGFEEIEWKFDQIRGVLGSIDETLKTPSATQANEWRQIAEGLRRRDVLDESEKFFLKSFETNPLDYRTYIGLGKIYLQIGKLDKARTFWQKSLPHAPKGEIDYKSYSYRLIGRLDFCEDNPQQAVSVLKTAIELSPNYYLGHYDYAQYCAQIGDKENCLSSLRIAVVKEPIPLDLAKRERNFEPLREEVETVLRAIESDEDVRKEIKFRRTWKEITNPNSKLDLTEISPLDVERRVNKAGEVILRVEKIFEHKAKPKFPIELYGEEELLSFDTMYERGKEIWEKAQAWLTTGVPARGWEQYNPWAMSWWVIYWTLMAEETAISAERYIS